MKLLEKDLPAWQRALNMGLVGLLFVTMITSALGLYRVLNLDTFLNQLELLTYDVRVNMPLHTGQPKDKPSQQILMVMFDEMTQRAYNGVYGSWPWPRSMHADMIRYLNAHGAKAIAYDLMFVNRQHGREASDNYFIETFRTQRNVYLSMNFDNDLAEMRRRGLDLTPQDIALIQPYAVELENRLDPKNPRLQLNETGFFNNEAMNFNNYTKILPELLAARERVAFINHGADPDGVSRGNPLIYRFIFDQPVRSEYRPYGRDAQTGVWTDTQNRRVNAEGYLLDDHNQLIRQQYALYYPYLAMRLFIDLKFPNERVKFTLTPDGYLAFKNYKVPLASNGIFLPRWYNVNIDHEAYVKRLEELKRKGGPQSEILRYQEALSKPKPYLEIPAWQVLDALHHEKKGLPPTEDDLKVDKLVKDKVIFIGNSSVSGYDIKATPVNKQMPGVFIQAVTFDTLWRNEGYMLRIHPYAQMGITALLCLLGLALAIKARSTIWEFLAVAALVLVYVITACVLFKFMEWWIEIVIPLFIMLAVVIATLIVKYVLRNIDYEKTYALANTDSMTGLYNHHFFKRHINTSIERARQFNLSFALILIDIDFFKKFNDTYGHQAGDEVLRCVARKLKDSVRNVDVVCRYGGEEMAVILDGADNNAALVVAQKLVTAVAEEAYPIAEGVAKHVTISVGVATYPQHGSTLPELVEFADRGLYRAKEGGRNQVGAQHDAEEAQGEASA